MAAHHKFKLADGSVVESKLAVDSVTTDKIFDTAVNADKVDSSKYSCAFPIVARARSLPR